MSNTTKHTECPERDIRAPLDHPVPPDAPVAFAALLSREVPAPRLPQWMAPDFAAPAMPTLDALLEGLSVPEWLRRAYAEMADPVPFRRAAALGLVARLWEPTTARDRATLREWLRAGRGTVAIKHHASCARPSFGPPIYCMPPRAPAWCVYVMCACLPPRRRRNVR